MHVGMDLGCFVGLVWGFLHDRLGQWPLPRFGYYFLHSSGAFRDALGPVLGALGRHLGALGRHLGSS